MVVTVTDATSVSEAGVVDPLEPLRHAVVEGLMGIIGAPDDPGVARVGDEAVRDLDAALLASGGSA
jgi:hypothetical protein